MDDEKTAGEYARRIIRAEQAKRGMSYADLRLALTNIGVIYDERNLRNKIARGTFSAGFFLQCLYAMNVPSIGIDDILHYGIDPKSKDGVAFHEIAPEDADENDANGPKDN